MQTAALQTPEADQDTLDPNPTFCKMLEAPGRFNGKILTLDVEIVTPRRLQIMDPINSQCGRIPVVTPNDPDVRPRAKFKLKEDANLTAVYKNLSFLLPPPPWSDQKESYRMLATIEGRFDTVYGVKENGTTVRVRRHLGYLGADEYLFVLKRVLEVKIVPSEKADNEEGKDQEP